MRVIDSERQAKEIIETRRNNRKQNTLNEKQSLKMKSIIDSTGSSKDKKTIPIMIKADVQGSTEAIKESLIKLENDEVEIDIVSSSIGGITESDINLAEASDAFIIGFNVRADSTARKMIKDSNIDIKYYSVIYETIEDVEHIICLLYTSPSPRD